MKRNKTIILAAILTGSCLFLSGCGYEAGDDIDGIFKVIKTYRNSDMGSTMLEVLDTTTGIHYYQSPGNGSGLTPVIEKNGRIRGAVYKEEAPKNDTPQDIVDLQKSIENRQKSIKEQQQQLDKQMKEYSELTETNNK